MKKLLKGKKVTGGEKCGRGRKIQVTMSLKMEEAAGSVRFEKISENIAVCGERMLCGRDDGKWLRMMFLMTVEVREVEGKEWMTYT